MDLYADNILDHFKHPHRKVGLTAPTVTHAEQNLSCGDGVEVQLLLEGGRIVDIGWSGSGCAISQAGMSLLADELAGKTLEEVDALSADAVLALLGVPVGQRRMKCALLSLLAAKNALRVAQGKAPLGWLDVVPHRP